MRGRIFEAGVALVGALAVLGGVRRYPALALVFAIAFVTIALALRRGVRGQHLVLAATLSLALLINAPGVRDLNQFLGQHASSLALGFAATAVWTVLVTRGRLMLDRPSHLAVIVAGWTLTLAVIAGGTSLQAWAWTIFGPALLFVGLSHLGATQVSAVVRIFEVILLVTVAIAAGVFVFHAGSAALNPDWVFDQHTNLEFQGAIGRYSFGNPNNASVIFVTALAFGFARLKRARSMISLLTITFASVAIYAGSSRGAWASSVLVILLATWPRNARSAAIARFLAVFALVGIAMAWWFSSHPVDWSGTSFQGRRVGREAALRAIMDTPVLGAGPGGVRDLVQADEAARATFGIDDFGTAHDFILNWGVETGALGLFLLVWLIYLALRRGSLGFRHLTPDVIPLIGFLTTATATGISMVNDANPAWAYLFWFVLATALRMFLTQPEKERRRSSDNQRELTGPVSTARTGQRSATSLFARG